MNTTPEPETAPESPWAVAREELARARRRYRRQGVPLAAIGGTHLAGGLAAAATGSGVLLPLGAGLGAAAAGYGWAHRHGGRWQRAYAGVCAACSAGWQTTAVFAGAGNAWMVGTLWLGGAALALPWWWRHAEPDPDVTAEEEAPPAHRPVPPTDTDERVMIWGRHLAGRGKTLAGSRLHDLTEFAYGWKATVQLAPERHWHEIISAHKTIASAYDLPDGRVFTEAVRGDSASVRRGWLTVLTTDPLQQVRYWTGPGLDPETGTCPLMTTADGQTQHFRFWWPGQGAAHALVSGINGSGKSKILDLLIAEGRLSDRIEPWFIDGGGTSKWLDKLEMSASTPAQARELLKYALRRMEARRTLIRHGAAESLDPTPEVPLICIVIDEAHKLLMSDESVDHSDIRRMCERLAQEGRKFGIQLILATQVPSANQLGGSTVLRDQVKSGTVVGLRVAEATSGNMITSGAPMPEPLQHLPREFPDGSPTRGLGYVLTGRMIRSRSLLIEDHASQGATPTRLSAAEMAVRPPNLAVADEPGPEPEPAAAAASDPAGGPGGDDADAQALVEQALANGAPTDPVSLMGVTGLSLGQVRRALAARN